MLDVLTDRMRAAALAACLPVAVALASVPAAAQGLAGAYLAAMQADFRNDYAAAAEYFSSALAADPGNLALAQNAAIAHVAMGEVERAVGYAETLAAEMPDNQVAALVLMAEALRNGEYDAAAAHADNPALNLNPLLAGLVSGWIEVGRENFAEAQARFDALQDNDALEAYGQYHKALALALAGDFVASAEILAGDEGGPLHPDRDALIAHAEILAQLDREDEAVALIDAALADGYPDDVLDDLRAELQGEAEVSFSQIESPSDGAAEAFFTLATALNTDNADRFALIYARLAQHIRPDLTKARLLAAEVLERHGQYQLATVALEGVPSDNPWYVTSELRRAATQRASGDAAGGIETLQALAETHPDLVEVHTALGDALRVEERYEEAAAAYSRAIEQAGEPQAGHWVLYYSRAIAHERAGDWPPAEEDFRTALELQPGQPLVLNYLGYSLVEQRRNLDEALDMIERAVAAEPDDGYITDSLGWVLYRLGRYEEAVEPMLTAVELLPSDAVINDHLGDVLWMVGREREAEFQWRRALSLGPADDLDMERIRRKLEVGLDAVLESEGAADGEE